MTSNEWYVWVNKLVSETDELKESILRFTSSELTSHAANFIGLSIIIFSYLTLAAHRFPRVPFSFVINLACKSTWDYMFIFLILWFLNAGIIFALARLMFYGLFAYQTINISNKQECLKKSLKGLYVEISKEVEKRKVFGFVRVAWFKSGVARLSKGLTCSFVLGFITAAILFWTFFIC